MAASGRIAGVSGDPGWSAITRRDMARSRITPGPPKPQLCGLRWPYRATTWARVSTGAADGTVHGAQIPAAREGGTQAAWTPAGRPPGRPQWASGPAARAASTARRLAIIHPSSPGPGSDTHHSHHPNSTGAPPKTAQGPPPPPVTAPAVCVIPEGGCGQSVLTSWPYAPTISASASPVTNRRKPKFSSSRPARWMMFCVSSAAINASICSWVP